MKQSFSYISLLAVLLICFHFGISQERRDDHLRIYFFIATTCPISQQYTKEINRLYETYGKQGVEMFLVFPNNGKKNIKEEIKSFYKTYDLSLSFLNDKRFKLSKKLNATVTPEAFLVSKNDEVLYHGAIDNWYYQLGKNRMNITEHYLEDAIVEALNKKSISRPFAEPTGCFIEATKVK